MLWYEQVMRVGKTKDNLTKKLSKWVKHFWKQNWGKLSTEWVVTIVLLLLLTLFGKRGIFTCSPLSLCTFYIWYKINLISFDNSLIIYSFRSKVLLRRNQCLLAQTHRTLTRSPITFNIRFSSSLDARSTLTLTLIRGKVGGSKSRFVDSLNPPKSKF